MLMLQNKLLFIHLLANNKINCGGWEDIVNDLLSIFQNPEMKTMIFTAVFTVLIIVIEEVRHKNSN